MSTSSFYKSSGSTPAVENSIQTAVTQAAGSATQAQTSATSANTSATNAQSSLNSFQQYYLGAYSSAPSTTQIGSMYFNTSVAQLYIWSGNSWDVTASANNLQDTDGLIEGSSNLYFTNERVDDRVNALLTAGSNITLAYNDAANTLTIASTGGLADLSSSTTNDLTEGSSNLYFTNARASSAITGGDLDMGGNKVLFANVYSAEGNLPSANTYHGMFAHVHGTGKGYFAHAGNWHKLLDETSSTTTDLSEGSNLYYTDERVDDRVSNLLTAGSNITLTYNDAANTLTIASTASGGGGSSTFTGLTDTPASLGTAGQYLAVNSGASALEFVAAPSGGSGATTLSGLNDVSNATPANNQVLTWDSGTSLWQPITPTSSGSGIALTDLSASNNPPGNATLNYNSSTGNFIFTPPDLSTYITATSTTTFTNKSGNISQWTNDSGYLTSVPSQTLYDLSNVYSSSSPSDGQVLSWDNANSYWKPTTVSAGSSGIALTDLSASNGVAGNASLSYNNSTGAFTFTPPDLSGYATTSSLSSYATTASLATVATSGAYGDLTGTPNLSSYLTGITGESLYSLSNVNTSSSPTDGQVLTWDNANSYWKPTTVSSGTSINYLASTSTSAAATNSKPKSIAIGSGAEVGTNAQSTGIAIAIGDNAKIGVAQYGGAAIMIGADQEAGYESTIISAKVGFNNVGAGNNCTIVGSGYSVTGANRNGVTLLGSGTHGANYSTAIGYMADAQHSMSVAIGLDATTTQANQMMLGDTTSQDGFTSIRVGNNSYQPSHGKDLTTKDYVDNRQLANLFDVDGTQPADGQVLTYDITNAYWYPATPSSGGGGSSYLDVNSTGTAASATGTEGISIGATASSAADHSVIIGFGATGTGNRGIAIGRIAEADGQDAMGLGYWARGQHLRSVALGYAAETTAGSQLMLGATSSYGGFTSIKVGNANYTPTDAMDLATKQYVDAGGSGGGITGITFEANTIASTVTANQYYAMAIGSQAHANGTASIALGYQARTNGARAISIGYEAGKDGDDQQGIAIGDRAVTNGQNNYPIAIGYKAECLGGGGIAIGGGYSSGNTHYFARASLNCVAIGMSTYTYGTSVAVGHQAWASGVGSTAIGRSTYCTGSNSTAIGQQAQSTSANKFVLGNSSVTDLRCQDTSISSVSDRRDKTQIELLAVGLDFVNAVEPKAYYKNNRNEYYVPAYTDEQLSDDPELEQSYTFNQSDYEAATKKFEKREFGFVAQDVAAELPDEYSDARVSFAETDDLQGFDVQRFTMGDMTPILWKALRELSNKHDQLQADYDALLARVVALENA
jgi:hypothetical protein